MMLALSSRSCKGRRRGRDGRVGVEWVAGLLKIVLAVTVVVVFLLLSSWFWMAGDPRPMSRLMALFFPTRSGLFSLSHWTITHSPYLCTINLIFCNERTKESHEEKECSVYSDIVYIIISYLPGQGLLCFMLSRWMRLFCFLPFPAKKQH